MKTSGDVLKVLAVVIMIGITVRYPTAAISIARSITDAVSTVLYAFTYPVRSRVPPSPPSHSLTPNDYSHKIGQ